MAQSHMSRKRLNIIGWAAFQDDMFVKSKSILIYELMTGNLRDCLLTNSVRVTDDDSPGQLKALTTKRRANQEMVNYIWNALHPLDQSVISQERADDNLPAMWAKLKKHSMPDQVSVDKLIEQMYALTCDARGVLQFIEACKKQQERLHSSEAGQREKSLESFLRFCVQRFPMSNGWEDFKLRFDATPATSWSELTIRVEKQLSLTGQANLQFTDQSRDSRREQHQRQHNRAFMSSDLSSEPRTETRTCF